MLANIEIRQLISTKGIKKYEISEQLGIQDSAFSRKLRKELPQEEKEKILDIIKRLSN